MKAGITYVDTAKLETIWTSIEGLTVEPQAGWVKIHGPKGLRVYVPRGKTASKVGLAGFEVEGMGCIPWPEHGGAVKQQLDFSLPENEILANFELVLRHMLTLPPVEKAKKQQPGKAPRAKAKGMTLLVPSSPKVETNAEKRARLQKVSEEMGIPLSAKTVAELEAPEAQ